MTTATGLERPSTHVLRDNRDFRMLWSGQAASTLGSQMSSVAMPLLVLGITGSPSAAGAVAFAGMLALLIARLPGGVLADRVDRRKAMIACDLGRAAVVCSIAVAALTGTVSLVHLYVASVAAGLFTAVFGPAAVSSLPRVVPRDQMSAAMTRSQLRDQTASLCGPPLGGVLYAAGRAFPFVADAVSYLLSATAVGLVRTELTVTRRPRTGVLRDIREAANWLSHQRKLVLLILWSAAANFTMNGVALGVIIVARQGGASASLVGVMDALGGLGGVIGALAAGRMVPRLSARQALTGTGVAWAGIFATMSLTQSPWWLGVLLMLTIAVAPTTAVIVSTALVVDTPDEMQARVSSTAGLVASSANPLGPLLMGLLLGSIGSSALLVFAGVVGLGTLGFVLRSGRLFDTGADRNPRQAPDDAAGGAADDGSDDGRDESPAGAVPTGPVPTGAIPTPARPAR